MPSAQEDTKKQNKGQRGPPVKQFQWFQMQTRVRKIIQEIIDPMQFQLVKNASHIQKLQKNNTTFNERLQYVLRMTTNDPQVFEKGVFKRIQDKFQLQQKTLTFLQEQVKNNTSFIDNKINLIDQRMKQSNDMILQIQELKKSNRESLKHQTEKFEQVRKNIQENVQKMAAAIEENQKNSRQKMERIEKQLALNSMKMQSIQKQFNRTKQYVASQKGINDELIAQGIKLRQQNKDFQIKCQQINKKLKQLSKIKPFLQDIQTEYKKVLFKLDNILPLITEGQINQSLYKILPAKFHPRIAVYEFQRYLHLNQLVLNRHFEQDPTSINFNGQKLIRQSQERNTKLLTKLKRQYYKNNGVDLDFISFEERERLLNDFDYPKLCQIVDQLEQLENQKNDRKKNHRLTEQDIIKLVKRQVQNDKTWLVQKIQTQMKDSKTYLQNSSEQVHKIVQNLELKITNFNKNLQNIKNANQLSSTRMQEFMRQVSSNLSQDSQKIKILHQFSQNITNFAQKSYEAMKKVDLIQKKIQRYDIPHSLSVHHKRSAQKQVLPNQQNFKSKIGVMIMSDSDDNYDSKIIHEKENQNVVPQVKFVQQTQQIIFKLNNSLSQFSSLNELKIDEKTKFRSNFSKTTKPSESDIKYKSNQFLKKNSKYLNFSELNKSGQIHHNSEQNSDRKGFLDIPSFKNLSSTKYCRDSYTSRLSMRKKPTLTPSKAVFTKRQQKSQENIKNAQVRNSLSYFSELKKENQRYLY